MSVVVILFVLSFRFGLCGLLSVKVIVCDSKLLSSFINKITNQKPKNRVSISTYAFTPGVSSSLYQ